MYNELYLIEILHQTTTRPSLSWLLLRCILSKFYIKPQLVPNSTDTSYGCILSKFYIKPQQRVRHTLGHSVVSYRNSTSNHNIRFSPPFFSWLYLIEILHQTTTHMLFFSLARMLYLIEILHQTTTLRHDLFNIYCCILSKFYIKPQQGTWKQGRQHGCILSKFYIKPQPMDDKECLRNVVSYRNSTSNHNYVETIQRIENVVSYRNSTSNHNSCPKTSS